MLGRGVLADILVVLGSIVLAVHPIGSRRV